MDRSNDETVIVAGKVRSQLEDSRDYLFAATGIPLDVFRPN